jgi:hypothetical protein
MKDPTRGFRRLDADGKRLASETYRLWRQLAPKRGNPYGDHQYGLRAGYEAVEASRYEDGLVILAAIRKHMDAKAVPARIAEWARLEGSDRRAAEHRDRQMRERETPMAPAVAGIIGRPRRPQRPHPATHDFVRGPGGDACAHAPDGIPCGGPPGVHVRALDQRIEEFDARRRSGKQRERVPCPECGEPATPGSECARCRTFLTTGPRDDEEHAMAATLRLWRQPEADKPMRGVGE